MGRESVNGGDTEEQKEGCYAQIRTEWIIVRHIRKVWARALFVLMEHIKS